MATKLPLASSLDLDEEGHWRPVVGVAADTRNNGLTETDPEYYRLTMANSNLPRAEVALFRTSLDPAGPGTVDPHRNGCG